jgi:hypothetical protein
LVASSISGRYIPFSPGPCVDIGKHRIETADFSQCPSIIRRSVDI